MTALQIGSLVWLIFCVVIGIREIYAGLPDVRARVRAGEGTAEDLRRLKKKKWVGWIIIIGPGLGMTLPDLIPLVIH